MFDMALLKILVLVASVFKADGFLADVLIKTMPDILRGFTKECKVIFICGSCGKSITLAQTVSALKASGARVLSGAGSCDRRSVIKTIIKGFPLFKNNQKYFAVFEVSAADMAEIIKLITPDVVAVTNVFEDKNPEVDIYELIETGCHDLNETVFVLNGDEPMLYNFMQGKRRYFYGFRVNPVFPGGNETDEIGKVCKECNQPYKYIYNTYGHLGNYSCVSCGKTRPQLALGVDNVPEMSERGSQVSFDGLEIYVPLAGGSNIYNALCAATVAGAVGVEPDAIKNGIEAVKNIPTVQESIKIDTKELRLISVGSALDCTESVNSILPDSNVLYIACLFDKNHISWIDSVPFEKFINLNYHGILIGGDGYVEMTERLEKAGLDSAKFMVCEDFDSFLYSIRTNVIGKTYVFASKSIMKSLRKNLHKKKYLKKL